MTAQVNEMHMRMQTSTGALIGLSWAKGTHGAHGGQQQGGGHLQGKQGLVGIFPSPLPAGGVGHVDAQEQFPDVSAVLEPEREEPRPEPKAPTTPPKSTRPRLSGLLGEESPFSGYEDRPYTSYRPIKLASPLRLASSWGPSPQIFPRPWDLPDR